MCNAWRFSALSIGGDFYEGINKRIPIQKMLFLQQKEQVTKTKFVEKTGDIFLLICI